jgi:hypothetical protein
MTPLIEAAVSVHELFLAYVEAGFSESQAIRLCAAVIQASAGGETP